MPFKNWLMGKSAAEQRVDDLSAHVEQLREEMHRLEAKIAENRHLGLSTSAYDSMYATTRQMYVQAREMLRQAISQWEAER